MRVRVNWIAEVSDDYRRAIRRYYGRVGIASRDEVKAWFRLHGESMDDDLMAEFDRNREENEQ